jgi:hypothetical protein
MAIERYKRTETIQPAGVVSGSGFRAEAEAWGQVGRTSSMAQEAIVNIGAQHAEAEGEQEGEKAVWVDPNTGKPQIVGTLPEGTRPYAVAYRKAAEARYQAELGLSSITKAQEVSQANAGNPEGFRNAWQGYIDGITESVPESIRPGVNLLLKEQGVKHYYQMQQEDFARTQGEAKVATSNLFDAIERDVSDTLMKSGLAGGSPEFMSQKRSQVAGLIGDQVRAGIFTPEEANARLQDYDFRTERALITGEAVLMAKDGKADQVQGLLDEYVRSPNGKVDDYRRGQISDYARGVVSTELAKAKAENTAAMDFAKRQVKDAQEVWWKGESHSLDDQQVLRIAQSTGDPAIIADTQAALAARVTMKQYSLLSPQQQEAALSKEQLAENQTGDTLKLRENLETIYNQTITAVESGDTLQLAHSRGLVSMDPIDPANPLTMQKRAKDIATVDQNMTAQSNPLVPAEKEQFIRLFDGMDSEGKIALYGSLKENMGHDIALRAMRQLGQERPAMALAMAVSDDAPEVSRKILMGDLALQADKNVLGTLASGSTFPAAFQDYVGSAIQGDDTLRNAVFQAAQSVYADNVKRNPDLRSDENFQKAIDYVTGGVAEYNGFKTIVPKRGMTGDDFEDLIDGMDDAAFRKAAGGHKLVTLGGDEISADMIHSKGTMEWIGEGQYILKLSISDTLYGQTVFLADDKGLIKDEWGRPVPAELDLMPFVGGR